MGEQFIAHLEPTPELTRWARRYLRASRPRRRVWKSIHEHELPWRVIVPGLPGITSFPTFTAAIAFATTKGMK